MFAGTPRCAVGLSKGSYEVPVHSLVSGCPTASVAGGHQCRGGLLEALQQIFLHQAEPFAPGLPAQDTLHPCRWTLLGPQPHPVIAGLQPLITVLTH